MDKHFTATAVVHDEQGRVLLVHHKKFGRWMCPGGHLEPNELPEEAMRREVREETGLEVTILPNGEPHTFGDDHARELPTPFCIMEELIAEGHYHIDLVYRCLAQSDTPPVFAPTEANAIRWFTEAEIAAMGEADTFPNVKRIILHSAQRRVKEAQ